MGIITSRFRRLLSFKKSPDVYKKELEGINKEILEMEKTKVTLRAQHHLITGFIVSYSILLYLMVVLVFFFSSLPSTPVEYLFFCGPLLFFYILIVGLKKVLKWYFDDEIRRYNKNLLKLYARKKAILSELKGEVKFREARDIIKNFSPLDKNFKNEDKTLETYHGQRRASALDNVVKYVLREETRNSLICKYCKCHNGMALEDEFSSISFRCCQCFKLNQSKDRGMSMVKEE